MCALEFQPIERKGFGGKALCRERDCTSSHGAVRRVARWRVWIAGRPVPSPMAHDATLLVCDVCKDRLEGVWQEALEPEPEAVPA